ncbi:MAG: hypothetical protein ACI4L1_02370 [Christensenellales bacterium]
MGLLDNKRAIIISGFAGVGKTGLVEHASFYEKKKIFDLSSSYFRKNEGWEKIYCDIVESISKEYDYIFISNHKQVVDEMLKRGLKFYIVYPMRNCRDEYVRRFIERGNSEEYITKFIKNWDRFISELDNVKSENKIKLRSGQYLSDVIGRLR